MRAWGHWLIGMSVAGASSVRADELLEQPKVPRKFKLSDRIRSNLNDFSNEFALRLDAMTGGFVDMRFDLKAKTARMHLGGGDPEAFRLYIDSNMLMSGGHMRVNSRIDLAVAGYRLAFEVPEFDVDTESVQGDRAVQLTLPVFEGAF